MADRPAPSSADPYSQPADALVILRITGDLARNMTFSALYRLERRGRLRCPIIGVARNDWGDDELRDHARQAIGTTVDEPEEGVLRRLCERLSYVPGDYGDPDTFTRVGRAIGRARHPVFYLEVPPSLFAPVVQSL